MPLVEAGGERRRQPERYRQPHRDIPHDIIMPVTMPDRHSTDPTERSIPPVMMTAVMPSAMMPTKAQLRATLNRLAEVSNVVVASER